MNMAPENPVNLTWCHVCAKCPVSRGNLRLLKTSSSSNSINHKYYFAYSTLVLGQLAKTYAMSRRNVGILTTDISWKDEWLRFQVMRNEERYDNKVSTVPFANHTHVSSSSLFRWLLIITPNWLLWPRSQFPYLIVVSQHIPDKKIISLANKLI